MAHQKQPFKNLVRHLNEILDILLRTIISANVNFITLAGSTPAGTVVSNTPGIHPDW